MHDLSDALRNIARAADVQVDPKRIRLNRADFETMWAHYNRLGNAQDERDRQAPIDHMIDAAVILTIMPLLVAAGWFLRG